MSDEKVYDRTCGKSSMSAIMADDKHAPHEKSLEVVVYEISRIHSRGGELVCIEEMFVSEVGCKNASVISKHIEESPEVADFEADLWDGFSKGASANKGRIFALQGLPHEVLLS